MTKFIELVSVFLALATIPVEAQQNVAIPFAVGNLHGYPIKADSVLAAVGQGRENYCHMLSLLNSQLDCYHKLSGKDTILYRNIILSAPVIRPGVIGEIERQYPTTRICQATHFNLIEGHTLASSYTFGLIWTDSTYYSYINDGEARVSAVEKLDFSELKESQKAIVLYFNDWTNEIFKEKEKSPLGTMPGTYYFGTRADFSDKSKIESIAFCY